MHITDENAFAWEERDTKIKGGIIGRNEKIMRRGIGGKKKRMEKRDWEKRGEMIYFSSSYSCLSFSIDETNTSLISIRDRKLISYFALLKGQNLFPV